MAKKNANKFLEYRGKPLVRCGNTIYYGNMNDPYVIMLQITSTKTFNDMEIADRVLIQLLNTDPDCRPRDRIVKKSEKKAFTMQWTSVQSGLNVHSKKELHKKRIKAVSCDTAFSFVLPVYIKKNNKKENLN